MVEREIERVREEASEVNGRPTSTIRDEHSRYVERERERKVERKNEGGVVVGGIGRGAARRYNKSRL